MHQQCMSLIILNTEPQETCINRSYSEECIAPTGTGNRPPYGGSVNAGHNPQSEARYNSAAFSTVS